MLKGFLTSRQACLPSVPTQFWMGARPLQLPTCLLNSSRERQNTSASYARPCDPLSPRAASEVPTAPELHHFTWHQSCRMAEPIPLWHYTVGTCPTGDASPWMHAPCISVISPKPCVLHPHMELLPPQACQLYLLPTHQFLGRPASASLTGTSLGLTLAPSTCSANMGPRCQRWGQLCLHCATLNPDQELIIGWHGKRRGK